MTVKMQNVVRNDARYGDSSELRIFIYLKSLVWFLLIKVAEIQFNLIGG